MHILDNDGNPTSIDALNARAEAWHREHDRSPGADYWAKFYAARNAADRRRPLRRPLEDHRAVFGARGGRHG